jgi:simple sugar transport system permease protein
MMDAGLFAAISGFLMIAFTSTTPLLLAAIGGIWSEKSGIVNIALEGKMLAGALAAVLATHWSGNPWIGVLAAMVTGIALALLHLWCCQALNAEHVVSGAAINILALGLTGFFVFRVFASKSSAQVPILPSLQTHFWGVPVIGPVIDGLFSGMPLLFLAAVAAALITHQVLRRTAFGLRVRAAGEDPAVAAARGVHVARVRTLCLIISGTLAGLAGAHLALGDIGFFTERMSAGRGFIALAAVIFGRWKPLPTLAACLFFGVAEVTAMRLKLNWQAMPDELALSIPFALTIAVLFATRSASGMPSALGRRSRTGADQ